MTCWVINNWFSGCCSSRLEIHRHLPCTRAGGMMIGRPLRRRVQGRTGRFFSSINHAGGGDPPKQWNLQPGTNWLTVWSESRLPLSPLTRPGGGLPPPHLPTLRLLSVILSGKQIKSANVLRNLLTYFSKMRMLLSPPLTRYASTDPKILNISIAVSLTDDGVLEDVFGLWEV